MCAQWGGAASWTPSCSCNAGAAQLAALATQPLLFARLPCRRYGEHFGKNFILQGLMDTVPRVGVGALCPPPLPFLARHAGCPACARRAAHAAAAGPPLCCRPPASPACRHFASPPPQVRVRTSQDRARDQLADLAVLNERLSGKGAGEAAHIRCGGTAVGGRGWMPGWLWRRLQRCCCSSCCSGGGAGGRCTC